MYSPNSFQVKYRRRIYEEIASRAYSNNKDVRFKWIPEAIVTAMGDIPCAEAVSSDLDYATEACRVALGLEPCGYREADCGENEDSLSSAMNIRPGKSGPLVGALKSICYNCAKIEGQDRACTKICPKSAISLDASGRAVIDAQKCDSCGLCLKACPYGAIADKSSIYQVIRAIGSGKRVYALLIPSFSVQFRQFFADSQLCAAFRFLGFNGVFEAMVKNDIFSGVTDYCGRAPDCGAWLPAAQKDHPGCTGYMSDIAAAVTSAVSLIKEGDPDALVTLIVPCTMRKIDAEKNAEKMDLDFALSLEELLAMFDARGIDEEFIRESDNEVLMRIG